MANGLDIISKMVMELLDGIESIFEDPLTLDQQELRALDLILGGRAILKFFTDLPKSDEGLIRMIEDLRIWEISVPMIKKDRLNALITALKNLQAPVVASEVIKLVAEGIPTRMDGLIQHLTEMTTKDVGDLNVITIASWDKRNSKSVLEREISSTTVLEPAPRATSSSNQMDVQPRESTTRQTLDRLKEKLRSASSALNRPT